MDIETYVVPSVFLEPVADRDDLEIVLVRVRQKYPGHWECLFTLAEGVLTLVEKAAWPRYFDAYVIPGRAYSVRSRHLDALPQFGSV